jgi:hypothetical protein
LRKSKQGDIEKRDNSRAFSVRILEAGKNLFKCRIMPY